jgi:hypothetical protein
MGSDLPDVHMSTNSGLLLNLFSQSFALQGYNNTVFAALLSGF